MLWEHSTSGMHPLQVSVVHCHYNDKCSYKRSTSGAGDSDGRTSWTAKPELADYVSIYCFLLYFLCILETGGPEEKLQGSSINQPLQTDIKGETEDPFKGIKIILGGYSYGSLIASHLPTLDVITNLFKEVRVGSALYEICSIAEEIFVRWRKTFRKQMGIDIPRDSDSFHNDGHGNLHMKDFMTPLSTSYLLISPILPPISQLLTVFSTMSLNVGSETSAQGKHIPCPKPADQLRTHRTLAIYGNQDTFTSARKLQKWSEGLARALDSNFRYREIDKAGHFWREDGVEMQARRALRDWLHFGE